MSTLTRLAVRMNALADDLDNRVNRFAQEMVIQIVIALANSTPVDTSTALSNWQVQVGSPVVSDREPFFPGRTGSTRRSSIQATIADARRVVQAKTPGTPIYITNVLPYIVPLNRGTSRQAPAGFVEVGTLRGRELARRREV